MVSLEDLFPEIDHALLERALGDPVNRAIVRAYYEADERRRGEVYSKFVQGDEVLRRITESRVKDPIEWWRTQLEEVRLLSGGIAQMQLDYAVAEASQDTGECEELRADVEFAEKTAKLAQRYVQLYPMVMQFYAEMAKKTRSIAAEEGIDPVEAAQVQDVSDRALKAVFQTREKADAYLRAKIEFMHANNEIMVDFAGRVEPTDPLKHIILSRKEKFQAMLQAEIECDAKELDRLYGSAQQVQN